MATVEAAARSVIAAIGEESNYLLAAKWIADRYAQIFAKTKARHLRRIEELYVPATIAAGTVTLTRDSTLVTGDATARAAWDVVGGVKADGQPFVGRHIRPARVWYEIAALEKVGGNTVLRLRSPFAEDSVTAGVYTIAARYVGLKPDVRWIGDSIVNMARRRQLRRFSLEEMNMLSPSFDRTGVGQQIGQAAEMWCELGDLFRDNTIVKGLHLYPYSATSELYHYVAYPMVPHLRYSDPLPPEIDEHVVREGALVDAFRYKMAQELMKEKPNVEAAAVWRNETRTQETKWERIMLDAIRADRGTDDLTFILQTGGWVASARDITNAHEMVYDRWPR